MWGVLEPVAHFRARGGVLGHAHAELHVAGALARPCLARVGPHICCQNSGEGGRLSDLINYTPPLGTTCTGWSWSPPRPWSCGTSG